MTRRGVVNVRRKIRRNPPVHVPLRPRSGGQARRAGGGIRVRIGAPGESHDGAAPTHQPRVHAASEEGGEEGDFEYKLATEFAAIDTLFKSIRDKYYWR